MATTEKILRQQAKTAQDSDKKAEVAYVRAEKTADEEAARRLAEQYGVGPKKVEGPQRRTRGWKCNDCGFVNYDIRSVCGECLATNPEALSAKPMANIREPAHSLDPFCHLVTVQGRCYREFSAAARTVTPQSTQAVESTVVPTYNEDDFDECDDDYGSCSDGEPSTCAPGKATSSNKSSIVYDSTTQTYSMQIKISQKFWKFIIGAKGSALQETQRLTGATVTIPRAEKGKELSPDEEIITIKAPQATSVRAAHLRISAVVSASKDKVDYTHFISIPLGTIPSLQRRLTLALDEVKQNCCAEEKKIEPSLFQDPVRLHLTLLMLRLHTSDELAKAMSLFTQLQREINRIFTPSDKIHLRGLNYMNDDPTEVHVVYLEIERTAAREKLIRLINHINETFIEAGLALEKDVAHNEKLHATVVNSKWRKSSDEGAPREAFDASDLLRMYGTLDLGDHRLESVELSTLGGGNSLYGYFHSECSIQFPKA
jgi:activating signal cointegrator complex subunit 1